MKSSSRFFPTVRRDWSSVFFETCALMVGFLIIINFFLIWGINDFCFLVFHLTEGVFWKFLPSLPFIMAKFVFVILGIIIVLTRKASFTSFLISLYIILSTALSIGYFTRLCFFIYELTRPIDIRWLPSSSELLEFIMESLFTFFLVSGSCWTMSVMKSLYNVLDGGGTGWEKQNYKDIKLERARLFMLCVP